MIQVLLWLPLAAGLVCFGVPRRAVPAVALLGTLGTLALSNDFRRLVSIHFRHMAIHEDKRIITSIQGFQHLQAVGHNVR